MKMIEGLIVEVSLVLLTVLVAIPNRVPIVAAATSGCISLLMMKTAPANLTPAVNARNEPLLILLILKNLSTDKI